MRTVRWLMVMVVVLVVALPMGAEPVPVLLEKGIYTEETGGYRCRDPDLRANSLERGRKSRNGCRGVLPSR